MSGSPQLTVCTVTFQSARVIRRSLPELRRALDEAGIEAELHAVDNASRDGSADVVSELWPGARVTRRPRNLGYAAAMNRATEGARGRWLLLINPDTLVSAGTFAAMRHGDALPRAAAVSPLLTDESGRPVRTAYAWPTLGKELARLAGVAALAAPALERRPPLTARDRVAVPGRGEALRVDYVAGACLFVPADVWRRVGPFDEGFRMYHEEMEWSWRAARLGRSVWVLPGCRAVHLGGASSAERPAEVVRWRYEGLLRFYELHRAPPARAALRAAVATSFGSRALASRLAGRARPEYEAIVRAARRGAPSPATGEEQ